MEAWNIYIDKGVKEAIKGELSRLKVSHSEHLENVLGLIDLKQLKTKRDYYSAVLKAGK